MSRTFVSWCHLLLLCAPILVEAGQFDYVVPFSLQRAAGVDSLRRYVRQADEANVTLEANATSGADGMCAFVDQCWQSCDSERPPLADGPRGLPGPTGPKGVYGRRGLRGEKGERGAAGPDGIQGEAGERGNQGAKGEKGGPGLKGDPGTDDYGDRGAKGDRGEPGTAGEPGRQGCKGQKGDVGLEGLKGDLGPNGDVGPTGEQGDVGIKGMKGPVGSPGQEAGKRGTKGDKGVKGGKGVVGSIGGTGEKGETGPPGRPGSKITVNVTTAKQKEKDSHVEMGEKGDKGTPGDCAKATKMSECRVAGPKGEKGKMGEQGPSGPMGLAGNRGPSGDQVECDSDKEGKLEFIKGIQGRPASRPPMVRGEKGDSGSTSTCSCQNVTCPQNVTIDCTPENYTVQCDYQVEIPPARPGPRGLKGERGDPGPPGTEAGEQGPQGDQGLEGECQRCPTPAEKELVFTHPHIYVLHEQAPPASRRKRQALECAASTHEALWHGFSLLGATVDRASDAFYDVGGPGSCVALDDVPEKSVVSFTNAVEAPNGLSHMRAQLDRSTRQEALWLGAEGGARPSRCVVCRSLGPVSTFHGASACPAAAKRNMRWVELWRGKSLANLGSKVGVEAASAASCTPQVSVVRRNSCPPGQSCGDGDSDWQPRWRAGDASCAVCALEPAEGADFKVKLEGSQFVQHSQVGSLASPGCKAGHTQLFDGYSLLSTDSEGGTATSCSTGFAPLLSGFDCVRSQISADRRLCKPHIEHSTWMLAADYVPSVVQRAVMSQLHSSGKLLRRRFSVSPSHMEFLLTRKHNSTDLDFFRRSHVSRCSVCLSRGPIYVQHGLEAPGGDASNLTCRPGFSKLWHGYSFVMASLHNNSRVIAKDLSSPESCLRSFEPIMALDCPPSKNATALAANHNNDPTSSIANVCSFPFSTNRSPSLATASIGLISTHWLANPNGHLAVVSGSRTALSFGERHSELVSRCVVCELNVS